MKSISKYKVEKTIWIPILIMAIISITTIYSADNILPSHYTNLALKQLIWYILGTGVIFGIMTVGNKFIYKSVWLLYAAGIFLLFLLLISPEWMAEPINGSKAWFTIPYIGTFQPSEFMKIIIILTLGVFIHDFNDNNSNPSVKEEGVFILKILGIVLLPSILTFMQPDTGVVIIYFIIAFAMLFVSGIRKGWFVAIISVLAISLTAIILIYNTNDELFINLFGSNFFYRMDRLMFWKDGSGMQLNNSLAAIGSGGLFGNGFGNTAVYFPEAHTDFIFAVFASTYGLFGCIFFLLLIIFFDLKLISTTNKKINNISKYVITGIIGMIVYQQLQNIGMTVGLLPITGITLPFISYGGSSLLSYMIIAGIIFTISNETIRYTN